MPFVDENNQPVQLSPEDQTAYWQKNPPVGSLVDESGRPINPVRDLSAPDLAELSTQHKDKFDLISAFNADPEAQKDPNTVQKVADAFHILREQPLLTGVTPTGVIKNVWNTVAGLGRFGAKAAGGAFQTLSSLGTLSSPAPGAEDAAVAEQAAGRQKLGEMAASAEQGMTGLVTGAAKIAAAAGRGLHLTKSLKDYTPEDKVNALFDASAVAQQAQQTASGQGPIAQAVTGGAVPVRPEEVAQLTSPFDWEALGGGMKLAGAAVPTAVSAVSASAKAAAGELLAKGAGRAGIEAPALATKKAVLATEKVAPLIGGVSGAVAGGHVVPIPVVGHVIGAIEGASRGADFAEKFLVPAQEKLAQAAEFGKQVAGTAPMKSAYAQAIRSALEATPAAAIELGKGAAFDVAMASGGDTPQEREAAIGLGTAFGLLGAANVAGKHVISGQIIAPRGYDVSMPIAGSGKFPSLEALHKDTFSELVPGQQQRLNAVRDFLKTAAPGTDVFNLGHNRPAIVDALQKAGLSPQQADFFSKQGGFSTEINGRKVIGVAEPGSAPHEAFHAIEDVLGDATLRKDFDPTVRQQYSQEQWDAFGREYAQRLTGTDPGEDWKTPVIQNSKWGGADAAEKLYREAANQFQLEANRSGAEPPTEQQVRDRVNHDAPRLPDDTVDWQKVLTPAEQQAVADRYISRELLAENFDAWFKHAGPTLEPGHQMPETIARKLGQMLQFFGVNPLAGKTSEGLGVPLNPDVIQRLAKAGQEIAPEPKVAAKAPAKTPAGLPQAPEAAARVAASAPDEKVEGATMTQREVSDTLAAAVGNRGGARLTYRSAPGEPAGAPAQNRTVRRAVVEYSRTMPDAQKPLWQKLFFPWRADLQQSGETTWGGWTPEVFAANANRVAQWAAETGNEARLPFAVDTANKTFTPGAWTQLLQRTQSFVQNQMAGRTGSGEPLVVPKEVTEAGGYQPPLGEAAEIPISQNEADFISMLFGTGQLPKTARFSRGELSIPGAIAGEEVSKATLPGRVQPPVVPRGTFEGAKAEKAGVAGRTIMEVNPLRAELERAGNFPQMLEAYQKLNLRNILHAEPAPEQAPFGANTLALRAGFMPGELPPISPEKEATIRGRIEAGIKPEDMRFSVFNDPNFPQFRLVQADEITGGKNTFSSNPEQLRALGYEVPTSDEILKLPQGQYTLPEALEKLKSAEASPSAQFKPAPNEEVRKQAEDYTKLAGLDYVPHTGYEPVNEERAKRIADAFQAAEHRPDDPEVQKAYAAFKNETLAQWDFLKSEGVKFEPWRDSGQPYATSAEMTADIKDNKHLWYFPTDAGFGEKAAGAHPLLEKTGETVNGKPVLYNDAFRAVHDYFGHAKEGYEFGPRGEYNAYLAHSKMFSPEANPAMAAETLGQNSWVNFGEHLRNAEGAIPKKGEPGYVAPAERPFAEQKATTLDAAQFMPKEASRKSKQDWEFKKTSGSFSKAWILPDGKPVQLGGQWHHEWVNENPEIAKKYGLKATTSGEENRVEALQKGFARINYERNSGTLKVEARAQDWAKLAPSVKEMVRVNLPHIDNMDVHLLDDRAKKIVDQDGVALHTYDAHEKMDHIPLITETSPTTTMSAQAPAEAQYMPMQKGEGPDEVLKTARKYWITNAGETRPAWGNHAHQAVQDFLQGFIPKDKENASVETNEEAYRRGHVRGVLRNSPNVLYTNGRPWSELSTATQKEIKRLSQSLEIPANHNGRPVETGIESTAAQFRPSLTAPDPEEFKDIRTLPAALAKPNWAILTGTKESLGSGTDEVNRLANENLEKALIADGFNPIPVKGSYKGVDQGQNFLVTGMSPEEAQKWGQQYGQESVLTPDGLLFQNGEVNPILPGEHKFGPEAEKQDFYSQIEGGPAFSMGIDFSKKVPLAEARKPFEVRGPVGAAHPNLATKRGRQRSPEEVKTLSLKYVLENPDMEDFAKTTVEKIKTVPGFNNISAKSIPKALTQMVDRMADNLRFLYKRAAPENRALWRQWYDLAKKMTQEWGPEYGFHPDVVAAVNARLSPQTDWYNNVTLTRAVLDTFKKNPEFTEADRRFLKERFEPIVSDKDRTALLDELAGIKDGAKLSELNDTQAGMLLRSHNETTRSLLTHDHNLKLTGDYTGWGKPFDDLRSVISILRNPSFENVDRELGNNHKVRSFYNNHVAPESPDWTTVDTHAAAAATLMPYGSKDQQIKDVFGSPRHKASGYNGTYFLYQHAYEQVAKELGILPRELQSIVWEQMRHSLTPETKRSLQGDKFAPILKVHKDIDSGKITPEAGREKIMDIFNPEPEQRELPIQPLTRAATGATLSPEIIQALDTLEQTLLHMKAMQRK